MTESWAEQESYDDQHNDDNYVYDDDPEQDEIKLSVDEKVQPGDIIRVAERLF